MESGGNINVAKSKTQQSPSGETQLSSWVPEMPEIDNECAGIEYGPVSLSGAP